jgi:succinyl-CoA synthetase beta subunit
VNGAGAARVTWEVVNHRRGEDALSMKMGAVFSSETLVYFCKTVSQPRRQHSEHHLKIRELV